jgi:hypothetical protein
MAVLEDQVVAVELILEIELVDRVVEVFRQLVIMPPVEALMEEKHSPVIPLVAMVVAMVMVAMAVAVAVIPVVVVLVIKILVVDREVVADPIIQGLIHLTLKECGKVTDK